MKCLKCNMDVEETFEYCLHCGAKTQKSNEKNIQEPKKESSSGIKKICEKIKKIIEEIINLLRIIFGAMFILMTLLMEGTFLYKFTGIALGISLLPFVYKKLKALFDKKEKIIKKWSVIQITLPVILFFVWACSITIAPVPSTNNKKHDIENSQINTENNTETDNKTKTESAEIIAGEGQLKTNFINACNECNIDVNKIKDMERIADWNNGPRYRFSYSGNSFLLYAFDNGQISSINLGDIRIYEDGFKSLNVEDFITSISTVTTLKVKSEDIVKLNLNFPDTASFSWLDWGAAKRYNYYAISGTVTAKNAFGVKQSLKFYIEYKNENGNWTPVYATLDNKIILGAKSQWPNVEKEEKQIDVTSNTQDIILKYGIKGGYGKEDLFDGEKYIRYYLPSGKYTAEAIVRNSIMYVETIKIHKEDGWDTADVLETIKLENVGDEKTFEIKSGYCVSLTLNSQIKILKEN